MPNIPSISDRLLSNAGIVQGMRVLDVGCGSGEVSRLVSALVGDCGEVIGVDPNEPMIAKARAQFRSEGIGNASFIAGDICEVDLGSEPFDAVVGRRVLMYLPDLDKALSTIGSALGADGLFAFQEHDRTLVPGRCSGDWTVHDRLHRWIWDTVEAEGANTHLGFELPAALVRAGFKVEHIDAAGIIPGIDRNASLATIVQAMQERIVGAGFATAPEIDQPTLEHQLATERDQNQSPYLADMAFSIIARKA